LKTFSFLFFMRFLALLLCFALPLSAEKVLEKLQHSATKDAPTLWHLRQPEVQARIKTELAALISNP